MAAPLQVNTKGVVKAEVESSPILSMAATSRDCFLPVYVIFIDRDIFSHKPQTIVVWII